MSLEERKPTFKERSECCKKAFTDGLKTAILQVLRTLRDEAKLPDVLGQGMYFAMGEECECPYGEGPDRNTWMAGWMRACRQDHANRAQKEGRDRDKAVVEEAQKAIDRFGEKLGFMAANV